VAVIGVVDDVRQGDLNALSRAPLPLVVIDPQNLPRRQVASVGATNFAGGLAATEHLLSLGHRRIAYLNGEATSVYNQARLHGYRAALEAAGVEVPRDHVLHGGGSHFEDGVAAGAVFDQRDRPRSPGCCPRR
jgi:LacI family transcriptional regulator